MNIISIGMKTKIYHQHPSLYLVFKTLGIFLEQQTRSKFKANNPAAARLKNVYRGQDYARRDFCKS
jgi:hypothetical protein